MDRHHRYSRYRNHERPHKCQDAEQHVAQRTPDLPASTRNRHQRCAPFRPPALRAERVILAAQANTSQAGRFPPGGSGAPDSLAPRRSGRAALILRGLACQNRPTALVIHTCAFRTYRKIRRLSSRSRYSDFWMCSDGGIPSWQGQSAAAFPSIPRTWSELSQTGTTCGGGPSATMS